MLERIMQAKNPIEEIMFIDKEQLKKAFGEHEESMIEHGYVNDTVSYDGDLEDFLDRNNIHMEIVDSLAVVYFIEKEKKYRADIAIETNRHDFLLGSEIFIYLNTLEQVNDIFTLKEEKLKNIAHDILDEFEELLEDKDLVIQDEQREGNMSETRLYGNSYYDLEDKIIKILREKNI